MPIARVQTDQAKVMVKSRFKKLFDWQFSRVSSVENIAGNEFEPNSVCLGNMVQKFMEEGNEKQSGTVNCSRNRCNCFHGNCSDSSDDDEYYFSRRSSDSINADASELLKSLVSCVSNTEKNLLSDTAKQFERNKICNGKRKEDYRKTVMEDLVAIGYDASICKSKWEKSSSYPSGEYEYIDVIIEGQRFIIDIDFKSEFEIARSTGTYKSILQFLPLIYVGKSDRLQQIVTIVSDAAKQSLKKKGMHIPPWRKAEFMRAKWLSPYTRTTNVTTNSIITRNFSGEFELIFKEKNLNSAENLFEQENIKKVVVATPWEPPAIKPKSPQTKIVAGLASVLEEKP